MIAFFHDEQRTELQAVQADLVVRLLKWAGEKPRLPVLVN